MSGVLFYGGPANGQVLAAWADTLPFYVRVAVEPWVGACQPIDKDTTPYADERVAVYVRPGEVLRTARRRPTRGYDATATYVFLEDAPADELRTPEAWQQWARERWEDDGRRAGRGRVGETRWPLPEGIA